MNFSEIWAELEARAPDDRDGRMVRRVNPDSDVDLRLAVEVHQAGRRTRRTLELEVAAEALEGLDPPAGTRQVDVNIEGRGPGRTALILGLEDAGARDLFAALCMDVASATAPSAHDDDAVSAWTGRFAKWRRMLQGGQHGLSPRRQRGLFAELLTIRERLLPAVGFDEAVRSWKGPDGAPRDFEMSGVGVEIKSSAANEPQVVPVNGERQLDDTGLEALVLVHESLDVLRDAGETLPGIVRGLRELGEGCSEAGTLEDRLLQCGYADVHEPLYRRTGYELRRTSFFHVRDGFPRITEEGLADGVGSVRYALAIDACRDFEVGPDFLTTHLTTN